MTIAEAKNINMVEYLGGLGWQPKKVSGDDHWYLSPLRKETVASFKINSRLQAWYDFGMGKGGNIIDLGILIFNCTVSEFLERLNTQNNSNTFSFHQQPVKSQIEEKPKIFIKEIRELQSSSLKNYLESRFISFETARQYLKEMVIAVNDKEWLALGLKNNAGGFELRGLGEFKSSTSPKDYTSFQSGNSALTIVEGMFDFLSHQEINKKIVTQPTDWLILNSLSFIEKAIPLIKSYERAHLMLDNDIAGKKALQSLLALSPNCIDLSQHYKESKDLNEMLMKEKNLSQREAFHKKNKIKIR